MYTNGFYQQGMNMYQAQQPAAPDMRSSLNPQQLEALKVKQSNEFVSPITDTEMNQCVCNHKDGVKFSVVKVGDHFECTNCHSVVNVVDPLTVDYDEVANVCATTVSYLDAIKMYYPGFCDDGVVKSMMAAIPVINRIPGMLKNCQQGTMMYQNYINSAANINPAFSRIDPDELRRRDFFRSSYSQPMYQNAGAPGWNTMQTTYTAPPPNYAFQNQQYQQQFGGQQVPPPAQQQFAQQNVATQTEAMQQMMQQMQQMMQQMQNQQQAQHTTIAKNPMTEVVTTGTTPPPAQQAAPQTQTKTVGIRDGGLLMKG